MDDTNTSNKRSLDLGTSDNFTSSSGTELKETGTYRTIDEEKRDPEKLANESEMVRNDNIESIDDGADEKMLSVADSDTLTKKEAEIRFISGNKNNGDAKIDIGVTERGVVSSLTKEELMLYVNDPFWVRLRWALFILFWLSWVGMLVGAIYIIIHAPKCQPPEPHTWYKQGPMIAFENGLNELTEQQINETKEYGATGVILKLPADETYSLGDLTHLEVVKKISEQLDKNDLNLVLDLTPNFVGDSDPLFKDALEDKPSARSAFVFTETAPPNWVGLENKPAFEEARPGLNVLSQFGSKRYDLRMDHETVKKKFKAVLEQLAENGVRGFRLDNTRHFIIDNDLIDDAINTENSGATQGDYAFYTHTHTTFRDGLGKLLEEYRLFVHNITADKGFLSTQDDIVFPEIYAAGDHLGVDIPHYGRLDYLLRESADVQQVVKELNNNYEKVKDLNVWVQIPFKKSDINKIGISEYAIFTFLLPGVPVTTLDALNGANATVIKELQNIRDSPSCMHGTFKAYADSSNKTIAYTRYKSGNPGYFVALNLGNEPVSANFTHVDGISPDIKVYLVSDNFLAKSDIRPKDKMKTEAVILPAESAAVFTYVATSAN